MKFSRPLFAALLLALVIARVSVLPAFASIDVTTYHASCSRLTASGTTDQDYVQYYVYNNSSGEQLVYESQPVSGGHFSISYSYGPQPAHSQLNIQIWGSPSSTLGEWDADPYLNVNKDCSATRGSGSGAGEPAGNLFDGRINNTDQSRDVAAPVAIYRDSAGTLDIYAIDPATGSGTKALTLTQADLNAQDIPTGGNLTLGDTTVNGAHIVLSRLTTGELQLNVTYGAGQTYIVVWSPDNPGSMYHPG